MSSADPQDRSDGSTLLKEEPRTRIEVLRRPGRRPVFHKQYRTPVLLSWRTFFLPSRAAREFRALSAARAAGIPCIEPLRFDETRRLGCVQHSAVDAVFIAGSSVKSALIADTLSVRSRRRACISIGRLLRRFHDAGLLWMDARPRNVILSGHDDQPVVACDLPCAISFSRPITGRRHTLIDLFSMGFSPSRQRDFSRSDQRAFLIAYCRGDRAEVRALTGRLTRRTVFRQRMERCTLHAVLGVALPAITSVAARLTGRSRGTRLPTATAENVS